MSRADPMATARRGERHFSCSRPRRSCSRPGRRPAAQRPKWGCRLIQPGCATAPVQFEPLSTRPWGVVADGSHGAGDVDARTTPQSTTPWPPSVTAPHRRRGAARLDASTASTQSVGCRAPSWAAATAPTRVRATTGRALRDKIWVDIANNPHVGC